MVRPLARTTLRWAQVNAWRLAQHGLAPHFRRGEIAEAVTRTGGIQAQVMSAAELAIGTRLEAASPAGVQSALWKEHTLLKTWAMRGALHLLTASELPLYVAARSLYDRRKSWLKYFQYFGVSQAVYDAYLETAPQVLSDQPLTRELFAQAVGQATGSPELQTLMLAKGWGTPLKPLAWRGTLCFGPNQGRNVTFVNPARWLGPWQPAEPYPALREMVRRYLRAYGPANPEEFAHWWDGGTGLILTRKVFQSMDEELERVDMEGRLAFALRDTLEPMQALAETSAVNLLPLFDAYVLGLGRGQDLEPILAREYQALVYRPQGWISAVVLEGGYMRGLWESQAKPQRTTLQVRLFHEPGTALRAGLEAEAQRLSAFWNTRVDLDIIEYTG